MDPGLLMSVLAQGEEQARQLKAQLENPLDAESCRSLARQVQSTFQTAIAVAKHLDGGSPAVGPDLCGSESPTSENSDQRCKEQEPMENEMMCKKRLVPVMTT